MEQIANALPTEVALEVGGETLTITPFKVKHLNAVAQPFESIYAKARTLGLELAAAGVLTDADSVPFERLLARCTDEVIQLAQVATGKPRAWVEDLDLDELFVIASVVFLVNKEKYERKIADGLGKMMAAVQAPAH